MISIYFRNSITKTREIISSELVYLNKRAEGVSSDFNKAIWALWER